MNDIFRVSADGGTPMAVSADRYSERILRGALARRPGLAFTARGIAAAQWWRKGHSHLDE